MLISSLSNNASFATVRNATDRLFYLGHRVTQVVDIKNPLFLIALRASTAAVAVIVAAVILYAIYQRWNKVVVVSPANNPLPPSIAPRQPSSTEQITASKQEKIETKLQEMAQSHQYHAGYLSKIEEYLDQLPAQMDKDSAYKLKYIDEMIEEIAPTIEIFKEEVQQISEKTEAYFISQGKQALCEKYEEVRAKLLKKLKGSTSLYKEIAKSYAEKVDKMDVHGKAYIASFLNFIQKHFGDDVLVDFLLANPTIASCAAISVPVGIQNQGNSCWMNACIQSLFSSKAFADRLQGAPKSNEIFNSLRTLRECMVDGSNPQLLGEVSANIRLAVFGGAVQDYNKDDLHAFQDPGPMYALLLTELGLAHEMNFTRIAKGIEYQKTETEPQALFPITTSNRTLQEAVDELAAGVDTDNEYNVEGVGTATGSTEKQTFRGALPQVLIFRVKENYGVANEESLIDSIFNLFKSAIVSTDTDGQTIKNEDLVIDMGKLREPGQAGQPSRYRLVGVAKNISKVHYVAYGLRGTEWNLFDDANVTKMSSIVGQKGHYLVYEKMKEPS